MTELLFVYGSLKRDALHHDELRGAPFRGLARTEPGYRLVPQAGYLALVEEPGAGVVEGELFEVNAPLLAALDEFEGDGYERGPVRLAEPAQNGEGAQTGQIRLALAYLKRTR